MKLLTECALGLPGCGTAKPDPLHDQWDDTRDGIREMLEATTLADLIQNGREGKLRTAADGAFDWNVDVTLREVGEVKTRVFQSLPEIILKLDSQSADEYCE